MDAEKLIPINTMKDTKLGWVQEAALRLSRCLRGSSILCTPLLSNDDCVARVPFNLLMSPSLDANTV